MKKIFFFSLLAVLISVGSTIAQNRSINFNHEPFSELMKKAKQENKMIFVDCYTTWCGPCKWMAKNVFTNDTVADFYNKNFINAKIDMETAEGKEIAKKYTITGYPTMLYLNADGVQLHRTCGGAPAKHFISTGEKALSPNTQLATYTTNFNSGNVTAAFASDYFEMLDNACQSVGPEVTKYFSSVKESNFTTRDNWKIIYKFVEDYYSKPFQTFEAERVAFAKLYGNDSVDSKINHVYTIGLYSSIQNKDKTTYEALKTKLRNSKTKGAEKIIIHADIKSAEYSKDWNTYAALVSELLNSSSSPNPDELNNYAWAFYENVDDKKMLGNAEVWAKKATELADSYANNDTYAAVLYKLGKKAEAKNAAEKAIELAKKNGENYQETAILLEKISNLK